MMKIENNLNKKFVDYAMNNSGEDFASPSPDLWKAIRPHIPVKDKKRPFVLFLIPLVLLVAAGLLLTLYLGSGAGENSGYPNSAAISSLDGTDYEANQKVVEEDIPYYKLKDDGMSGSVIAEKSFSSNAGKTNQTGVNDNKIFFQRSNSANQNKSLKENDNVALVPTSDSREKSSQPDLGKHKSVQINVLTENYFMPYALPMVNTLLFGPNTEMPLKFAGDLKMIIPAKAERSGAFLRFGIGGLETRSNNLSARVDLPGSEHIMARFYDRNLSFFMLYNQMVSSKISISSGLHFTRISSHTAYDLHVPYHKGFETSNGNMHENHFDHSLPSELGDIRSILILARSPQNPIEELEDVNIFLHSLYSVNRLSMPLTLNYYFNRVNAGFYLGMGVQLDYYFNRSLSIVDAYSKHQVIAASHLDLSSSTPNNFGIGGQITAGYIIPLSQSYSLDISGVFFQNRLADYKYQSAGISAGLLYRL